MMVSNANHHSHGEDRNCDIAILADNFPDPNCSKNSVNTTCNASKAASICCSLPLNQDVRDIIDQCNDPSKNHVGAAAVNGANGNAGVPFLNGRKQRKLLCLFCDRIFATNSLRSKHEERCHSAKQARRSSCRFQQSATTDSTTNTTTTSPEAATSLPLKSATCFLCSQQMPSGQGLDELFLHLLNQHHDRYFGCFDCRERFNSDALLQAHRDVEHVTISDADLKSPDGMSTNESGRSSSSTDDNQLADQQHDNLPTDLTVDSNEQAELSTEQLQSKSIQRKYLMRNRIVRNRKVVFRTAKIGVKRNTRLQAKQSTATVLISAHSGTQPAVKKRNAKQKQTANGGVTITDDTALKSTTESKSSLSVVQVTPDVNPYPVFDSFYRVKKISDHSIDNLRIASLTFDDEFDKAFFNRIKCNIRENLLHHLDGKLFKNKESDARISHFEKGHAHRIASQQSTSQHQSYPSAQGPIGTSVFNADNYGCELSLNAATPTCSTVQQNTQSADDRLESQIEYGSKPFVSKKKTTEHEVVRFKYLTRRKYQASILENKENRDLSKLDMWTQLAVKCRQQRISDDTKSEKERLEYKKGDEYRTKVSNDELNRILDRRGPVEDLKEEVTKQAALDGNVRQDNNSPDPTSILDDLISAFTSETKSSLNLSELQLGSRGGASAENQYRADLPAYLQLQRVSSGESSNYIDTSDKISMICSSQETETFDINWTVGPTTTSNLVELTGEWARSRLYICAVCGLKVSNMKLLLDHKNIIHSNVWCQHYEFVGNQGALYSHLSIPGLGTMTDIELMPTRMLWKRSESRQCSKCLKQCNSLGELHRHVLECGEDWAWMLARKKSKYRPFGAKTRKKRRGLFKRTAPPTPGGHSQAATKENRKTKKNYQEGPRPRPSDAETIQRMLANLPAKRATRKLMSLKDGFPKQSKKSKDDKKHPVQITADVQTATETMAVATAKTAKTLVVGNNVRKTKLKGVVRKSIRNSGRTNVTETSTDAAMRRRRPIASKAIEKTETDTAIDKTVPEKERLVENELIIQPPLDETDTPVKIDCDYLTEQIVTDTDSVNKESDPVDCVSYDNVSEPRHSKSNVDITLPHDKPIEMSPKLSSTSPGDVDIDSADVLSEVIDSPCNEINDFPLSPDEKRTDGLLATVKSDKLTVCEFITESDYIKSLSSIPHDHFLAKWTPATEVKNCLANTSGPGNEHNPTIESSAPVVQTPAFREPVKHINLIIPKPPRIADYKIPTVSKSKLCKRSKGLNDCIAMLTNKLAHVESELTVDDDVKTNNESISVIQTSPILPSLTSNNTDETPIRNCAITRPIIKIPTYTLRINRHTDDIFNTSNPTGSVTNKQNDFEHNDEDEHSQFQLLDLSNRVAITPKFELKIPGALAIRKNIILLEDAYANEITTTSPLNDLPQLEATTHLKIAKPLLKPVSKPNTNYSVTQSDDHLSAEPLCLIKNNALDQMITTSQELTNCVETIDGIDVTLPNKSLSKGVTEYVDNLFKLSRKSGKSTMEPPKVDFESLESTNQLPPSINGLCKQINVPHVRPVESLNTETCQLTEKLNMDDVVDVSVSVMNPSAYDKSEIPSAETIISTAEPESYSGDPIPEEVIRKSQMLPIEAAKYDVEDNSVYSKNILRTKVVCDDKLQSHIVTETMLVSVDSDEVNPVLPKFSEIIPEAQESTEVISTSEHIITESHIEKVTESEVIAMNKELENKNISVEICSTPQNLIPLPNKLNLFNDSDDEVPLSVYAKNKKKVKKSLTRNRPKLAKKTKIIFSKKLGRSKFAKLENENTANIMKDSVLENEHQAVSELNTIIGDTNQILDNSAINCNFGANKNEIHITNEEDVNVLATGDLDMQPAKATKKNSKKCKNKFAKLDDKSDENVLKDASTEIETANKININLEINVSDIVSNIETTTPTIDDCCTVTEIETRVPEDQNASALSKDPIIQEIKSNNKMSRKSSRSTLTKLQKNNYENVLTSTEGSTTEIGGIANHLDVELKIDEMMSNTITEAPNIIDGNAAKENEIQIAQNDKTTEDSDIQQTNARKKVSKKSGKNKSVKLKQNNISNLPQGTSAEIANQNNTELQTSIGDTILSNIDTETAIVNDIGTVDENELRIAKDDNTLPAKANQPMKTKKKMPKKSSRSKFAKLRSKTANKVDIVDQIVIELQTKLGDSMSTIDNETLTTNDCVAIEEMETRVANHADINIAREDSVFLQTVSEKNESSCSVPLQIDQETATDENSTISTPLEYAFDGLIRSHLDNEAFNENIKNSNISTLNQTFDNLLKSNDNSSSIEHMKCTEEIRDELPECAQKSSTQSVTDIQNSAILNGFSEACDNMLQTEMQLCDKIIDCESDWKGDVQTSTSEFPIVKNSVRPKEDEHDAPTLVNELPSADEFNQSFQISTKDIETKNIDCSVYDFDPQEEDELISDHVSITSSKKLSDDFEHPSKSKLIELSNHGKSVKQAEIVTLNNSTITSKPKKGKGKKYNKKRTSIKENVDKRSEPLYCEICSKAFARIENLNKHKLTLTHIAKLSELEAKESLESYKAMENKSDIDDAAVKNSLEVDLNNSQRNNESLQPPIHDQFAENISKGIHFGDRELETDSSQLATIIDNVLEPCILQGDLHDSNVRRCKSLGERKSFDSENAQYANNTFAESIQSAQIRDAGSILKTQISILENIIENKDSYVYINEDSSKSNDSKASRGKCPSDMSLVSDILKNDDSNVNSFTNVSGNGVDLIAPDQTTFVKPTSHYEEISEDSTILKKHFDENKSRKVLNHDEELFLECCSLLKSSDVSNSRRSSRKIYPLETSHSNAYCFTNNLGSSRNSNDLLNRSRPPTPTGERFVEDISLSHSPQNTWNGNNLLHINKNLNDVSSNSGNNTCSVPDQIATCLKYHRDVVDQHVDIMMNDSEPDSYSPISEISRCDDYTSLDNSRLMITSNKEHQIKGAITKLVVPVTLDQEESSTNTKSFDRRVMTKGARKVFEGFKVSIPTEDLNMAEVFNCSPSKVTRPETKEIKRRRNTGNKLGMKVKKKIVGKKQFEEKLPMILPINDSNKLHDVYDFEETQDNTDMFNANMSRFLLHSQENILHKNIEVHDKADSDDFNADESASRCSNDSKLSLPTLEINNVEETGHNNKKKCMIMGRIFKNAFKPKSDSDISEMPYTDNNSLVENYVMSCTPDAFYNSQEKKNKMSQEEMNALFDKLLNDQTDKSQTDTENTLIKTVAPSVEKPNRKQSGSKSVKGNRKRQRCNSGVSDDDFCIATKQRKKVSKNKLKDNSINLEQELKECIGVAGRKSQRKCTSGKQNVLVEYWSSDDSNFGTKLKSGVGKQNRLKSTHKSNQNKSGNKEKPTVTDGMAAGSECNATKLCVSIEEAPSNATVISTSISVDTSNAAAVPTNTVLPDNAVLTAPVQIKKTSTGKQRKRSKKDTNGAIIKSGRRKRSTGDTLYYWSSSSDEDELNNLLPVKSLRDEELDDDDEERPMQHGWIVGDSPKKLVTMLAQAKGKKVDTGVCVKEQPKKRTSL